jgi:hypothetical protein
MPLPDPILEVLMMFRPLFTAPTWRKLMILLTGTRLSQGRRTVAAALRHTGNSMAGNWSNFRSVAQPSPLVALSRESPLPASHCRNLCASRRKRGSGDR